MNKAAREAVLAVRKDIEKKYKSHEQELFPPLDHTRQVEVCPSPSAIINAIAGVGGVPNGRIIEIYGPESCLSGDTFVRYEVRTPEGRRQNHKGGSLEGLYRRFHGLARSGSGAYQRSETIGSVFFVPSVNEDGRVFQNRVTDVVSTGHQVCLRLRTTAGREIVATPDHRFWDGKRFCRLGDLVPGDCVYVHNNTHYQVDAAKGDLHRPEILVKHHPVASTKLVSGKYKYKRLRRYRAAYEAHMNGLSIDAYVTRLNDGDLSGLEFLPQNVHVHHVDENCLNDDLQNLVAVEATPHGRLHALARHNNLRFVTVPDVVESIQDAGERATFDIKVADPHRNYVAAEFVVHNCGKTTLAIEFVAELHRRKPDATVLFLDYEHAFDPSYAANLGVDLAPHRFAFCQPLYFEQGAAILKLYLQSGLIDLVVVDSVAAMTPLSQLEGDVDPSTSKSGEASKKSHTGRVGLLAQLVSQTCSWASKLTNTGRRPPLIFINQVRVQLNLRTGISSTDATGGKALKFYSSMRFELARAKLEGDTIDDVVEELGDRVRVKVTCVKNKVAPPFKRGTMVIRFGKGIDNVESVADLAEMYLGIKSAKGGHYRYEGVTTETSFSLRGRDSFVEHLNTHPETLKELEQQSLQRLQDNYKQNPQSPSPSREEEGSPGGEMIILDGSGEPGSDRPIVAEG